MLPLVLPGSQLEQSSGGCFSHFECPSANEKMAPSWCRPPRRPFASIGRELGNRADWKYTSFFPLPLLFVFVVTAICVLLGAVAVRTASASASITVLAGAWTAAMGRPGVLFHPPMMSAFAT